MPALPNLPGLPVTKLLVYFFTVVFSLACGIAVGTMIFKYQNPDAEINVGPIKQAGASPTPVPEAVFSPLISVPSPVPSPVSNIVPDGWLTYTNEILGFEFSHPPDITIDDDDLRGDQIQGSLISPAEYTYYVSVNFNDNELIYIASSVNISDPTFLPVDPKTAADALKSENESDDGTGVNMNITTETLGENNAYRVESIDNELLVFFLFAKGNNDASEITISVIAERSRAQTVDQIIKSFKFLE